MIERGGTPPSRADQRALLSELLKRRAGGPRSYTPSFAQERLWFLWSLAPNSPLYNVPVAVRLSGPLDIVTLGRAIDAVVQRHDTLRTTFDSSGPRVRQVVAGRLGIEPLLIDLTDHPTAQREAEALRLANDEAQRPFDLGQGPLVRVQIVRLGKDDHVLLLTVHHAVAEVWSVSILFRELEQLYDAFLQGRPSPLPPLSFQYVDYAHWQRRHLQGEALEGGLAYWRAQLGDAVPVLHLPGDRARPEVQTFGGAWFQTTYPAETADALRDLTRREGVTLFMTLLAGFAALLLRYTGQKEFVIGSPVAGRDRTEAEHLIGMFVNTLALRVDLTGDPTFRELLQRVREVAVGAFAHQHVPFEKVMEAIQPDRLLSHTPVFQVMFALQNTPMPRLNLSGGVSGRVLGPEEIHNGGSKVDLALFMEERSSGLAAGFEYNTDIFNSGTIERMAGHLGRLLATAATDPTQQVSHLPLLTREERRLVLSEWNATSTVYPRDAAVHALVEAQEARTPEATAILCGERTLSYAELNTRANQLARHLMELGVGRETPVGVCLERSPELIVALLGILKAGGAYVPLDPEYPKERLAFMLLEARAPVVVTTEAFLAKFPPSERRAVCLDRDTELLSALPASNPSCTVTGENIAYIMYTSGSTGTPKGVAVVHRGVTRLVCNTNYIQLSSEDCVAQASNSAFDAATFEIWGALVHGATLTIVPREVMLDARRLGRALRRGGVSTIFFTTALFNEIVRARPRTLAGIKQVLVGGEAMDPQRVVECWQAGPPERLLNVYGPTESTTFATWYSITAPASGARAIPIGRPLANTTIYLLDRHGEPVPVGVPGELYIGGDGLARGYLHQPALTAEKFVPDPFSATPGARLYRTGDLARWGPDGHVEFLGRMDTQVKIRGFRIEPGEIEAVLSEHPMVGQAVVVAREDTPGDKRLVAYVVPGEVSGAVMESLRAYVNERLPDYMRPAAYVFLERVPLTRNGKVDRRALPAIDRERPALSTAYVAPASDIEKTIAAIWEDALHLERVGLDDDFFDLGGHSFLLVEVRRRLNDALGRNVPLIDMFRHPTISRLARYFSQSAPAESGSGEQQPFYSRAVFERQLEWVNRWEGRRATPESFIVTLNESGAASGVFWCLQSYRELTQLARHLGPDQPVHGMRSGHHLMEYTDDNVAALGSRYVTEILALQPEGPFIVGGNCQGGIIARDVALRLRALGHTVSLLVLMEQGEFLPYDDRVALLFGRDSHVNPYKTDTDPEAVFRRAYPKGFTIDIIEGQHGKFFHSPNVETLAAALKKRLPRPSNEPS